MFSCQRRSEVLKVLCFSSLPVLSVFLDASLKFAAKSFPVLSTSASCEGKSQVKAFHKRVSAHKNEMYNLEFAISFTSKLCISMCSIARGLFSSQRANNLNICTLYGEV